MNSSEPTEDRVIVAVRDLRLICARTARCPDPHGRMELAKHANRIAASVGVTGSPLRTQNEIAGIVQLVQDAKAKLLPPSVVDVEDYMVRVQEAIDLLTAAEQLED